MDDIPDEIDIGGKKFPIDKNHYKKWALRAANRVIYFSQMKPMKISIGDNLFALFDLSDIVKPNPDGIGTTIQIDVAGPKVREGLVGMGGMYYHPENIGAKNTREVIESWNWLFDRSNIPKTKLENFLEGLSVMHMISIGQNQMAIFYIMGLAVDLKQLYEMNVEIDRKITELTSKIKGNWRAFNKMKKKSNVLALKQFDDLTMSISDLLAETRLAKLAKEWGMNVKMDKSPDILIDDVKIEAKFDRRLWMKERAFENKIKKGLRQGGSLVAIFTGNFRIKKLKKIKLSWFTTEPLQVSLINAIKLCKKERKCVLLYTGTTKGFVGKVGLIR